MGVLKSIFICLIFLATKSTLAGDDAIFTCAPTKKQKNGSMFKFQAKSAFSLHYGLREPSLTVGKKKIVPVEVTQFMDDGESLYLYVVGAHGQHTLEVSGKVKGKKHSGMFEATFRLSGSRKGKAFCQNKDR